MSVFSRLKSRGSFLEKAPEINTFNPEDLIPEDKKHIVDQMPSSLGITMDTGALVDAVHDASRALIIQREYPDSPEFVHAEELIDRSKKDLGHKSQKSLDIRHIAKPHTEMAEFVLGQISSFIDEAYNPATESIEITQADTATIGQVAVNQPVPGQTIAA